MRSLVESILDKNTIDKMSQSADSIAIRDWVDENFFSFGELKLVGNVLTFSAELKLTKEGAENIKAGKFTNPSNIKLKPLSRTCPIELIHSGHMGESAMNLDSVNWDDIFDTKSVYNITVDNCFIGKKFTSCFPKAKFRIGTFVEFNNPNDIKSMGSLSFTTGAARNLIRNLTKNDSIIVQ